jgi:acyl-coenzyme A thioesterase PaaI-like protein
MIASRPTAERSEVSLPERHPEAPAPGDQISSHYNQCFGCGDDHPTGLHMHVMAGEGLTISAMFTVTEDHQGAPGLAHGGLLTAAFDEALGSLAWLLRKPMVTVRLETEFRRPVPVGTTLSIAARVDRAVGRKIYTSAEGRIGGQDGQPAVRAAAVFVTVGMEHFKTHGRTVDVEAAFKRDDLRAAARRAFDVNP